MSQPVRVVNGENGSERVTDTDPRTGVFAAIYMNADTVFDVLTGSYAGGTGNTHLAGKWLYGTFTEVQAASGDYDLYNR